MRRRVKDTQDDQNYDSFLDIVANLVGILVILIMVIGVRARQVITEAPSEAPSGDAQAVATAPASVAPELPAVLDAADPPGLTQGKANLELERQRAISQELQSSIHEVATYTEEVTRAAVVKAEERNQLQLAVAMARGAIDKRTQALKLNQQTQLAVASQLDTRRNELARLNQQIDSVQAATSETTVLKNRPTPMAKLVFGNEEHFRLEAGRLTYVPITEMIGELTQDAKNNRWKLENANTITELLGPRDGFMMKYTFGRARRTVETPEGPRMVSLLELKRFVMVPQSSGLGEGIDAALAKDSQFEKKLARFRPDETTITLWVYPDGYGDFRRVREYLYQKGFTTAVMPVPHGFPIAGGPHGSTSAAQ